ncbi:MAG: TIGR04282 family arsenosugar biosynthesis glycosyltransferase [Saprospiraceae bacterium]|nr:TIGR04282 family arsenosugar biosynthesis glycosyltransferase [Saprospiraceae bacterium]
MKKDVLIIFIKNPIAGKVKTRIEKVTGAEKALSIYRELLTITRASVLNLPHTKCLYYSDFIDVNDEWSNNHFFKMKQSEGDLGKRMLTAFQDQEQSSERMLLIGSDCPYLTSAAILKAMDALDKVDVVIGPSNDGGYYLIGMKKVIPELFLNKNWSTDTLYRETIETLDALNFSHQSLDMLADIDHLEDWKAYLEYANKIH